MKKLLPYFLVSLLSLTSTISLALSSTDLNPEIRLDSYYYSWSGDKGTKGSQLVTPITGSIKYLSDSWSLDAAIRSAYIRSDNQSINANGSYSGISDTSLSTTITYFNNTFSYWYGFDINLPTGQETLSGSEKSALMDSNLVQQTRFGEGFNFSPTIGMSYPLSKNDLVSFGLSYNNRGSYVPDGDSGLELDPGDIFTLSTQYQKLEENYIYSLGFIISKESDSSLDAKEVYKPGNRLDLNFGGTYKADNKNSFSGYIRYTKTKPNKRLNGLTGLGTTDENSNGNSYEINLNYNYNIKSNFLIGVKIGHLIKRDNDYEVENDLFIPDRKKSSYGIISNYKISKSVSITGSLEYFRMTDQKTAFIDKREYDGLNTFFTLIWKI